MKKRCNRAHRREWAEREYFFRKCAVKAAEDFEKKRRQKTLFEMAADLMRGEKQDE